MGELELSEFIGSFYAKPYEFVLSVFPWGQETLPDGSRNPLRDKPGPEHWQADFLKRLGEHIEANILRAARDEDLKPWYSAVASGHGVGKSALVAWLIYYLGVVLRPYTDRQVRWCVYARMKETSH